MQGNDTGQIQVEPTSTDACQSDDDEKQIRRQMSVASFERVCVISKYERKADTVCRPINPLIHWKPSLVSVIV
jgi:hypothetical protein